MVVEQRANIKFCFKFVAQTFFDGMLYFVPAGRALKTLHLHQSREQEFSDQEYGKFMDRLAQMHTLATLKNKV
jgi:hypothetical protein